MKKFAFSLTAISISVFLLAFTPYTTAPTVADAPVWKVDKNHSSVSFSVRHFFSDVIGTFDDFSGELSFAPNDLDNSKVSFTIQIASVNTKNERRDGHLRSGDFFEAETWPTMSFVSSSFQAKEGSENEYMVKGQMTIRDVTKEVEIPITFLGSMEHPRRKGAYIGGFSSEFVIDRNEYGVGVGNYAATATIGGEVSVKINLEVSR